MLPGRITKRNISSGAQRENKPKLHDFLLYINLIISYSFRFCKNDSATASSFVGVAIFICHFEHRRCDWLNHTMWYLVSVSIRLCAIGWTIPRGSTRIERCPEAWNFDSMLLHFFYIMQMPICYEGCLIIANTWIYISLYLRNTVILENKKIVCIFPHQLVNSCDLHQVRNT